MLRRKWKRLLRKGGGPFCWCEGRESDELLGLGLGLWLWL
jgi:hypothetical protein